jgi:hypothetical protein
LFKFNHLTSCNYRKASVAIAFKPDLASLPSAATVLPSLLLLPMVSARPIGCAAHSFFHEGDGNERANASLHSSDKEIHPVEAMSSAVIVSSELSGGHFNRF